MTESIEPIATKISGHTFTIDPRFVLKDSKILGQGSFGVVCTAYDSLRRIDLAIKRIRPYANDDWDARHTLREVRLMKALGTHPNVITLYELSLYKPKTEMYMYLELMDTDLHKVIQSKKPLSERHFKCFMKQLLEGLKAMHAVGVYHRDLKPGNLLVSKNCELRITDFGLARFVDEETKAGENDENPMTEYVVTRWYRCPELLLAPDLPYGEGVDMWSVACIFAELLRGKAIFPGKDFRNQVELIFKLMGFSDVAELGFPISTESTVQYLNKHCRGPHQDLHAQLPSGSKEALQFLSALLVVNPGVRPSAEAALLLPYLADAEVLHDYSPQYLSRPTPEFFEFESKSFDLPTLKSLVEREVDQYQHEVALLKSRSAASPTVAAAAAAGEVSPTAVKASAPRGAEPVRGTASTSSAAVATAAASDPAAAAATAASAHQHIDSEAPTVVAGKAPRANSHADLLEQHRDASGSSGNSRRSDRSADNPFRTPPTADAAAAGSGSGGGSSGSNSKAPGAAGGV